MRVVQCATRKERAIGADVKRGKNENRGTEEERISGRIMSCNCGVHTRVIPVHVWSVLRQQSSLILLG